MQCASSAAGTNLKNHNLHLAENRASEDLCNQLALHVTYGKCDLLVVNVHDEYIVHDHRTAVPQVAHVLLIFEAPDMAHIAGGPLDTVEPHAAG